MKPFSEASYLAQVKRLRCMAESAVSKYPIKNYDLKFIQHGENATFKVITPRQDYLLRLHRNGYHTRSAILEELKWLENLSNTTNIPVQQPFASKKDELIILQHGEETPSRHCSILKWQSGQIKFKRLGPKDLYTIGELTAQLHKATTKRKIKHRNYSKKIMNSIIFY
ncbi:MAG: phosphotransferase [Bdellovibrionota bacterium]